MTDLTSLVEAVAADVWEQQKDVPWDVQDLAVKHAAREAVLPFVAATVKHMAAEVWDEGFDAGHQAARAVNPEWPALPTNPHTTEETR